MSETPRRGGLRKALLVALREYHDNVRTKTFWVGILIFPVILSLAFLAPRLLEKTKDARRYAVLDESGWLLPAVEERAAHDDAHRLLRVLRDQAREDDPRLALLPAELRALADAVKGASDEALEAQARLLSVAGQSALAASPEGALAQLDEATRERVAQAQTAFLKWRLSLTPEQARRVDASFTKERYQRVEVPAREANPETWLRGELEADHLFAYFVVGPDPVQGSEGSRYVSKNLTDNDLEQWFSRLATDEVRERRLTREAIAPELASWIDEPLHFEGRQLEAGGEETEVKTVDVVRQVAPVAFVYLLWVSIFTTTNLLLTNTIEEKSNRIIEVLLSSVSPTQLMGGKILGLAATGLTVVGSWIAWFMVAVRVLPRVLGAPAGLDLSVIVTDPTYLISFVIYFLFGYLFYSALLVGVGSVFNSLKEAQNLMQPLVLVLMVPLLAMIPISQDPNGTLARVLSWIPPFTPFVMMNRAAGPPATWEYVGTTILLIASVGLATLMAAKVFRIGILMTGKPPKITEIVRWALQPETATPPARD